MSKNNNSIHLQNFLDRILDSFQRYCFCDHRGNLISARTITPTDLNQMITAGIQIKEYLKPNSEEIFLTNDPNVTGCGPNEFIATLFFNLSESNDELFFICEKFSVGDLLWISEQSETTTQPIPPVPIFTNGNLQEEFLSAMAGGLGEAFIQRLQSSVQSLLLAHVQLIDLHYWRPKVLSNTSLKSLFNSTQNTLQKQIDELSLGEHQRSLEFLGSKYTVNIENEDELVFDFEKCRFVDPVNIDEKDLLSCVIFSLRKTLGGDLPLNQGLLNLPKMKLPRSPSRQRTNKSNAYTHLAAGPILCEMISSGINHIHRDGLFAQNSACPLLLQFDFEDGLSFSRPFFGGGGATFHIHGKRGWNPWINSYGSLSIENLERDYPIQISSIVPRPQSGGRGEKNGGEGLSWSLKMQKPGKLFWLTDDNTTSLQALGHNGGKPGQMGQLKIIRDKNEINFAESTEGVVEFKTGDILKVYTSGGGGYGSPPQTDHL